MTHYDCFINLSCILSGCAGCGRVVLISDNMMVTIRPTGKHGGLTWVAGGVVSMENMVYEAYVFDLKWRMGWWCYAQTQMSS